jgi:hypothetical protein
MAPIKLSTGPCVTIELTFHDKTDGYKAVQVRTIVPKPKPLVWNGNRAGGIPGVIYVIGGDAFAGREGYTASVYCDNASGVHTKYFDREEAVDHCERDHANRVMKLIEELTDYVEKP